VRWAEGVPGAEVTTVAGTTHDVHTEGHDIVVAKIRDALAHT
jgi:hypothetical protein